MAARSGGVGLGPAGETGRFFQRVPLRGIKYDPSRSNVAFAKEGTPPMSLKYLDDFVATDQSQTESSPLDSELVFVGHGVVAPEYKWADYKGLDTAGETLGMLLDDPPRNPTAPPAFKGKTPPHFGPWHHKYAT